MSTTSPSAPESGRTSALVVYAFYLLSIPSASIFALFGVVWALLARDGAGPLARSHLDFQIRTWFKAFWWTIGFAILGVIGAATVWLGIGFVILGFAMLGGLILYLWFTVVSALGLVRLLDNRPG